MYGCMYTLPYPDFSFYSSDCYSYVHISCNVPELFCVYCLSILEDIVTNPKCLTVIGIQIKNERFNRCKYSKYISWALLTN